jgi:peptidoglycan/LPS O-acetylase OafA/YrhL
MNEKWLPGGFSGVDMFFVISGYVVMSSLWRSLPLTLDGLVGFYARRLKRLLPAHVTVTVLTVFAMSLLIPPWEQYRSRFYYSGMLALVGWANNYFAFLHVGYFDDGNASLKMNPFTHTWSLGVEEQYYLVIPVFLAIVYASYFQGSTVPAIAYGITITSSALMSWWLTDNMPNQAFYVLPARLWELMAGALLFHAQSSNKRRVTGDIGGGYIHIVLQVAATVLIIASLLFTPEDHGFPFPAGMLPVVGALLFITAGMVPGSLLNGFIGWQPFAFIGKLSYPIYLLHWPVFVLCKWSYGLESNLVRLVSLTGIMILALAIYYGVEGPVRHWRPKNPAVVFVVGFSAVALAEACVYALKDNMFGDLYIGEVSVTSPSLQHAKDSSIPPLQTCPSKEACGCIGSIPTLHRPSCGQFEPSEGSAALSAMPMCLENIIPGNPGWENQAFFTSECHLREPPPHGTLEALSQKCLEPDRGRDGTKGAMFVVGDSHAGMLLDGLGDRFGDNFSITSFRTSGRWCCGFCSYESFPMQLLSHLDWDAETKEHAKETCGDFAKVIMQSLNSSVRRGDIVIVSNFDEWVDGRDEEDTKGMTKADRQDQIRALSERIEELHGIVHSKGAILVMVGSPPVLSNKGSECIPTIFEPQKAKECDVNATASELSHQLLTDAYARLESKLPGTVFFDIHKLLCDDASCGATIPGTNVIGFSDQHHVSEAGSGYLAQFLCPALTNVG